MDTAIALRTVDVIIPLFNKGDYVEQAVRSAMRQSYEVTTITVADDASSDGGPEVVERLAEEDPRVRLLRSPFRKPSGPSATRNRAIAFGDSEFVAMLDADDWWDDEKLALQMPAFDDLSVGLCHCLYRLVDADGGPTTRPVLGIPTYSGELRDAARLGEYAVTGSASAVVLRRSLLDDTGLFPENISFGEDWVLWARFAMVSHFHCVPMQLVSIRWIDSTLSRSMDAGERFVANLKVWSLWADDQNFAQKAIPVLRRHLASAQLRLLRSPYRFLQKFPAELRSNPSPFARTLAGNRPLYFLNLFTQAPTLLAERLVRYILSRSKNG